MTLQQLYYFQKIAELQHYNKAAKELHVAQPSLSKSMALLEEELNVPLFEKQGRNIILTKYGKVFQIHVNRILFDIDGAKREIESLVSRSSGHINVAYVSPFGHNYIPRLVRKFLEENPTKNITFSFKEGFTNNMIRGLHENDIDVVFGSFEPEEPGLEFFPIISEELVLIAPNTAEYRDQFLDVEYMSDVEELPFIAYDKDSNMGRHTRKYFKNQNLKMNIICESSDELSILALVSNEFGISYVAKTREIEQAIEEGRVIGKKLQDHSSRFLYMIYDTTKFHTPAILDFIAFVKKNYNL